MVYCMYSLEWPRWGDSNENTQHSFMLKKIKKIPIMRPDLALWLTLISSNYPSLEHIFSVQKMFEPLKFYCKHTCDISRFRRELPIWSLSSRSHTRETKPPDERFFQCHFSRTVFQSEHFIVYGSIYLANKLFTASKVSDIYRSNWWPLMRVR